MFVEEDHHGDTGVTSPDEEAPRLLSRYALRVKLGDLALHDAASSVVQRRQRRSTAAATLLMLTGRDSTAEGVEEESKRQFRIGESVKIVKPGRQEGKLASVTDPDWTGRVKVRMHRTGEIKSYEKMHLRRLRHQGVRGESFWGESPSHESQLRKRLEALGALTADRGDSDEWLWSAPEFLSNHDRQRTDWSSYPKGAEDTYAYGVILGEMYALTRPWGVLPTALVDSTESNPKRRRSIASDRRRAFEAILRGNRPDLPIDKDAPHGFFHLIDRCVRSRPQDRPQAECVLRRMHEIATCHRTGTAVMDEHGRRLRFKGFDVTVRR